MNLWRVSGSTSPIKQGNLKQAVHVHSQSFYEYFQEGRLRNVYWAGRQPAPVLGHPHNKQCFMYRWSFLCFSLCPVPLCLPLGITEKSLALSSSHPPSRNFIRFPLLSSPAALSSPQMRDAAVPLQYARVSFILGSPKLNKGLQVWPHQC